MRVSDYELVNNIDILFNSSFVIYGAGNVGSRVLKMLEIAGAKVVCFCDIDRNKAEYYGYEVISIDRLKETSDGKQYSIILASDIYYEDMLYQLVLKSIDMKYVFTGWGIEAGLIWNLSDQRIPAEIKKYLREKVEKIAYHRESAAINSLQKVLAEKPKVLIYQIGKVGSMTIFNSLQKVNVNCEQIHVLHDYGDSEQGRILEREYQEEILENGVKIISLVRDPIARFISAKLQGTNFAYWAMESNGWKLNEKIVAELSYGCADLSGWFRDEMEEVTKINILEYPFRKERGYTLIKKGNIELLLLTMEDLNKNEQIIEEFVGINNFHIVDANIGNNKVTKYLYESIKKELRIPVNILDDYYHNNLFLQHLYTAEQLEKFRNRWIR